MGNIICIKARSHSDFELYLIGEKYDMPYEFLIDYKKNHSVYKFWTEVGSGRIMAIEERTGDKKAFVPVMPMAPGEEKKLKATSPIIAGTVISKYRGDIEEKEEEFKQMVAAKEIHRKKMLNRKYDAKNIVCINARLTDEQIFAACLDNEIDFVEVAGFIKSNDHIAFTKVWYEKGTSMMVAYEYVSGIEEVLDINEDCLIPRDAIHRRSTKPIPTPKIKASYETATAYRRAKMVGFDLDIPKLERFDFEREERQSEDIDLDVFTIEDLKNLLDAALSEEDYESAAELRDAIREMENKSKRQ